MEMEQWVSLWLNAAMLHYLLLTSVYLRVLIAVMMDSRWEFVSNNPTGIMKAGLKKLGYCYIPMYGTWIAVCSLRAWILPNEALQAEFERRPFFQLYSGMMKEK